MLRGRQLSEQPVVKVSDVKSRGKQGIRNVFVRIIDTCKNVLGSAR
jgi:hypothetical protein